MLFCANGFIFGLSLVPDKSVDRFLAEDIPVAADIYSRSQNLLEMARGIAIFPIIIVKRVGEPERKCIGTPTVLFEPIFDQAFAKNSIEIDHLVEIGSADDEVLGIDSFGS